MTRPLVGIGVLIFNHKNEMLLGHRINSHGMGTWCNPGGHLEFGESFETCAIREVKEEIGVDITDPKFFDITHDIFEAEKKHYVSIFMQCNFPEGQVIQNMEPHKFSEWKWFDWDNLPENIFLSLKNLKSCTKATNYILEPN